MPLLCVDGVIRNSSDRVLLVKRSNEPLKGRWWVPGGRVLKGESLEQAFRRKMRQELGLKVADVYCIGYFEATTMRHLGLGPRGGQLHSLSMVFEARTDATGVTLDSQSSDWGFFPKLPSRFKIRTFQLD